MNVSVFVSLATEVHEVTAVNTALRSELRPSLDLLQISFGGLPASNKPSSGGRDNFVGCMEGIIYNGENITSLIRRKKVDTSSFVRTTASCIWCICVNAWVGWVPVHACAFG